VLPDRFNPADTMKRTIAASRQMFDEKVLVPNNANRFHRHGSFMFRQRENEFGRAFGCASRDELLSGR